MPVRLILGPGQQNDMAPACDLIEGIADRSAPIMANRTLALVRKMFNFAIEHEWLETNPCHLVKRPGQEKQRGDSNALFG